MYAGGVGHSVGGLVSEISETSIGLFFKNDRMYSFPVPCQPLATILKRYGVTQIDFFSLDVEGSELIVLQTMDWRVKVHVFLIELVRFLLLFCRIDFCSLCRMERSVKKKKSVLRF